MGMGWLEEQIDCQELAIMQEYNDETAMGVGNASPLAYICLTFIHLSRRSSRRAFHH
jgi:hypothetical protein